MPLNSALLERAQRNERFLATFDLATTPYLDWVVTAAFYAALRYVDAYFWPRRPLDHPERLRWVAPDSRSRVIFREFRELYDQSVEARYELSTFTTGQVQSLIANRLGRVKAHMLRQ